MYRIYRNIGLFVQAFLLLQSYKGQIIIPIVITHCYLQAIVEAKKTETAEASNNEGTSGEKEEEENDKDETTAAAPRRRTARRDN